MERAPLIRARLSRLTRHQTEILRFAQDDNSSAGRTHAGQGLTGSLAGKKRPLFWRGQSALVLSGKERWVPACSCGRLANLIAATREESLCALFPLGFSLLDSSGRANGYWLGVAPVAGCPICWFCCWVAGLVASAPPMEARLLCSRVTRTPLVSGFSSVVCAV